MKKVEWYRHATFSVGGVLVSGIWWIDLEVDLGFWTFSITLRSKNVYRKPKGINDDT